MDLFDDEMEETGRKELSRQEAFLGVLLAANASDGHVSEEEARGMFTILSRMRLYENWSDEKLGRILHRLIGMLKREGVEKLVKRCVPAIPEALRATVFANACDLVLADGTVEQEEREFINELWRTLGMSGDDAKTIVQVMVIKNKG